MFYIENLSGVYNLQTMQREQERDISRVRLVGQPFVFHNIRDSGLPYKNTEHMIDELIGHIVRTDGSLPTYVLLGEFHKTGIDKDQRPIGVYPAQSFILQNEE